MAKTTMLLIAILFSFQSFAKEDDCILRLINPLPHAAESELDHESLWINMLGGTLNEPNYSKWSADNILQRWNSWRNLTANQRSQAFTLELMKISPKTVAAQPTVQMVSRDEFKALSAANKERMLKQIDGLFPVSAAALENQSLLKTAKNTVAKVKFGYARPVNPIQYTQSPIGYDAPVASPRELKALDLDINKAFYSLLVGTSPSVGFDTLATKVERGEPNPEFAKLLHREALVLKPKFARQNGMALPNFKSVPEILDFFDFWDPKGSEEVFRANWNNLPKGMKTYAEFRAYLELHGEEFQNENSYNQLAALRTRLNQYLMTTEDAEDFLKQAFNRYILSVGSEDPLKAENIWVELSNSGAVMKFFRDQFFGMLKIPSGMQLRIPVAVSAQDYILSRMADTPVFRSPMTATATMNRGPFFDPRTVDHDSKP